MRVAVTIWGDRISPVFDASRQLLIAEMKNGRISKQTHVMFDPGHPASLANMLTKLDAPVLICGAVSQMPASIITAGGITLIPFITGQVNRVLAAYASKDSLVPEFAMPGCKNPTGPSDAPSR